MPLTMRPTGLGAGIDKDRPDYTVYTGEWEVGRIYKPGRSRQSALVLVAKRQRSDGNARNCHEPVIVRVADVACYYFEPF